MRQKFTDTAIAAQALGCTLLLVCPDVPPAEMSHADAVSKAAEESARYCEIAARYGVRIALEPLGGHRFVPGPTQAMEIIAKVNRPDMLLMMDTFHYYKSGVTLDEIRAIPAGVMSLIHVNSCDDLPRDKLTDKLRVWPTLGVIPTAEMIRAASGHGYNGALSVEVFRDAYWAQPIDQINADAKHYLDLLMARV